VRARRVPPGPAAALVTALVGCTSASFVPVTAGRDPGPTNGARIERARLSSEGRFSLSTRLHGAGGTRLHEARLVPAREPTCAQVGILSLASDVRQDGRLRWERPLVVPDGQTVEVGFADYQPAFDGPSAVELDLESTTGRSCVRLPLTGEALAWRPVPAPTLGLRFYADTASAALLARAGLLTGLYRPVLELGIGGGQNESVLGPAPSWRSAWPASASSGRPPAPGSSPCRPRSGTRRAWRSTLPHRAGRA
jgi:hypothetical protein